MEFVKLNEKEVEILNKVESNKDAIIQLLNEIALLEFTVNYNLGETGRICDYNKLEENEQYKYLKNELSTLLDSILGNSEFKYKIMNFGTMSISYPINQGTILKNCSQEVKSYRHTLNLPFAYVMGKGIAKKYMESWVNEMKLKYI